MKTAAAILLLQIIAGQIFTEPIVTARLEKREYLVGERITIQYEARELRGIDSLGPRLADTLGAFEILSVSGPVQKEGIQEWQVNVTQFDTGGFFIPAVEFWFNAAGDTVKKKTVSNPLLVFINSVEIDSSGTIRDLKPLLLAPWLFEDYLPYLIGVAVLALAVLLIVYLRRKFAKKAREETFAAPTIAPDEEALRRLRALEDERLWQQGKIKEYYSALSDILRLYIERRFGVFALESTSDEIINMLSTVGEARPFLSELEHFLWNADLVKFARSQPTVTEHEKALEFAYEYGRRTRVSLIMAGERQPAGDLAS